MEIYLASADLSLIRKTVGFGIFSGVITNPKVVADSGMPTEPLFAAICEIVSCAYYQVRDGDPASMREEAEKMLAICPGRMRIKVPATPTGLGLVRHLSKCGHPVMATIVPTTAWLVLALAAGASSIAPYGSMLQKKGIASKQDEVGRMQEILDAQRSAANLCVGIYDVTELPLYARMGVRSAFIWGKDVDAFLRQPIVDEAVSAFHSDWEKIESASQNGSGLIEP